jgi:23S rRNA (cytidine1920-2'-O)/16S rRNA (cytidine1409-2'-O)-methyltransferase
MARSRSLAQHLIAVGRVTVDGRTNLKPSDRIGDTEEIRLAPGRMWVSRGAYKLIAALDAFDVVVKDRRAIDIGASTGGFTEVLLERGATSVLAVDVGTGQLADTLRGDPRVTVLEKTDIRALRPEIDTCFDVAVVDVAFVSVLNVADALVRLICDEADTVILVKPQFEVQRADLGKGGVLRDVDKREKAVRHVMDSLDEAGLGALGLVRSPIEGSDGNVEFLLWSRKGAKRASLEVPK